MIFFVFRALVSEILHKFSFYDSLYVFFSLTSSIDMHKFVIYYANCLLIYLSCVRGQGETQERRDFPV